MFNSKSPGKIEILIRPSNKQELAFKLKTANRPFALIKIGDISVWLKNKLAGYEVIAGFGDEGFFERLNADDSDINILMGSRSFYEGWDSNRPNVICFINIGIGESAKKFILQAVGRGVRIEPMKGKRKRLLSIHNAGEVDAGAFDKLKGPANALETLCVFGTNRAALQKVIEGLESEKAKRDTHQLSLFKNPLADDRELLIPKYREAADPLYKSGGSARFELEQEEQELLEEYAKYIDDDRVMMAIHGAMPDQVALLRDSTNQRDKFFKPNPTNARYYRNVDLIVSRLLNYFRVSPQRLGALEPVRDEIRHFENIEVSLDSVKFDELRADVQTVKDYEEPEAIKTVARKKLKTEQLTLDEYDAEIARATNMAKETSREYGGKRINIKHVAEHYYIPVLASGETERIEFIKHIIQIPSEVAFLTKIEASISKGSFKEYDWWMFSKLDELDKVYIPYYDAKANSIREFHPDFVFWLQKGKRYFIVFVDPKGSAHSAYQNKIDGYRRLFLPDGKPKVLKHDSMSVTVHTCLMTGDADGISEGYKQFWFDSIESMLASLT